MEFEIDCFPDYTAQEITIGYIQSHSNLCRVLAVVPMADEFDVAMSRAQDIADYLQTVLNHD